MVNRERLATMKPRSHVHQYGTRRTGQRARLGRRAQRRTASLRAALDVLTVEPPIDGSPLLTAKNCLITPHIAWATLEAQRRLMTFTADNIAAFQRGEPIHVVN